MKQYTVYVCEQCGYESRDRHEIQLHEARHFGLTVEEMEIYRALKSFVAYMSYVISNNNTREVREQYNDAMRKLVSFEKEHRIGE